MRGSVLLYSAYYLDAAFFFMPALRTELREKRANILYPHFRCMISELEEIPRCKIKVDPKVLWSWVCRLTSVAVRQHGMKWLVGGSALCSASMADWHNPAIPDPMA